MKDNKIQESETELINPQKTKKLVKQEMFSLINNKLLGKGSFGKIYLGKNNITGEDVAIKVEPVGDDMSQLKYEYKIYKLLQGGYGFPKVYQFIEETRNNILIMELLGPSIEKIFLKYKRHFSLLTVVMIMEQILYRIEYLHSKNLIHRDIKPDNFLIGRGDKNKVIYAIDFGLAKKYKQSKTGLHIPYRDGKHLTGTARYTSINTHLGMEQSRRDDIEALGYMMVYLLRGRLPWQGMINSNPKKKYERIKKVKMETKLTLLCAGLPEEIIKFIQYARDMRFEDKPNYSYLRGLLRKIASRNALKMDPNKLDWIVKEKKEEEKEDENEEEKEEKKELIKEEKKEESIEEKAEEEKKESIKEEKKEEEINEEKKEEKEEKEENKELIIEEINEEKKEEKKEED